MKKLDKVLSQVVEYIDIAILISFFSWLYFSHHEAISILSNELSEQLIKIL